MEDFKQYKNWLQGINNTNPPAQTEQEKQDQLASDARIKGYLTNAMEDNVLAKMIGIGMINNGYIDPSLAQMYFIDRFSRR